MHKHRPCVKRTWWVQAKDQAGHAARVGQQKQGAGVNPGCRIDNYPAAKTNSNKKYRKD